MFRSQQEAIRVGLWIVAVAAAAGLLVLLLQGSAGASERLSPDDAAQVLMERTPLSVDEQVEVAESLLHTDRQHRLRRLYGGVLDAGWGLWTHASPLGTLRCAQRMLREIRGFRHRSLAEDEALDVLEVAMASGEPTPRLTALYSKLRAREQRAQAPGRLADLESALRAGDMRQAWARLRRSPSTEPLPEPTPDLFDRLASPPERVAAPAVPEAPPVGEIQAWEAPLAAALLAGDYDGALQLGASHPHADFAHAVASHLRGDWESALDGLEALSEREDPVGDAARDWLETPEFSVERALDRAELRYRAQRTLGWLGGEGLAAQGLELSSKSYRAWKDTISPLNLALSAPWRIYRGWEPDRSELREAASRYLEVRPHGEQADDASAWLDEIGPAPGLRPLRAWDDARFVLPPARTSYPSLFPGPVLVTRAVLDSEAVGEVDAIRAALGAAPAVMLTPLRPTGTGEATAGTPRDAVVQLLADVAHSLEQGTLVPLGRSRAAVIERIRRLESAVHAGTPVVARPWSPPGAPEGSVVRQLGATLDATLGDGQTSGIRDLELSRGDDDLSIRRGFGRASFPCPDRAACVDRERLLTGALYAHLDLDADARIGAHTSFHRASLAIEVGRSGPQASLVIPIGHWLGLDRWLPIEAHVGLSLEGIALGPRLNPTQFEEVRDPRVPYP